MHREKDRERERGRECNQSARYSSSRRRTTTIAFILHLTVYSSQEDFLGVPKDPTSGTFYPEARYCIHIYESGKKKDSVSRCIACTREEGKKRVREERERERERREEQSAMPGVSPHRPASPPLTLEE